VTVNERYRILFSGELRGGVDAEDAIAQLVATFEISETQARTLLLDGSRHVLRKDLDEADAQRFREALEKAGMVVQVEPMTASAEESVLGLRQDNPTQATESERRETAPSSDEAIEPARCPACNSLHLENGVCLDCGTVREKYLAGRGESSDQTAHRSGAVPGGADPYATPRADLRLRPQKGGLREPVAVPAGHGWTWIARGFWHFKANPFAWILAFIFFFGISILLSLIPILGGLANTLLSTVFIGGLMYGCREQDRGGDFHVEHLFAGFRENFGPLALVGLLYLIGGILIAILVGGLLVGALMPILEMEPAALETQDAEALFQLLGPMGMIAILVGTLLFIPLVMALLFAPALVMLDGLGAAEAMKQSFLGCLKNLPPFLIYGLVALALLILAVIPLGLGLLVVSPTLTAAIYVAYRDIYYA
jgi:ribosomal protein L32